MLSEYHELQLDIDETRRDSGLAEMEQELVDLKAEIDRLIVEEGVQYEGDSLKITRVQGFKRVWDVDKLEKIIPRPLFRKVIKIAVDGDKLDQLVREGKVDDKKIAPAYEETPNKAYARWTYKSDKSKGEQEATSLAKKLGKGVI